MPYFISWNTTELVEHFERGTKGKKRRKFQDFFMTCGPFRSHLHAKWSLPAAMGQDTKQPWTGGARTNCERLRVLDRVLRGRKRCFVVHFFRSLRCAANAQRSPRRRCNRCDENLSCRETRAETGAIRAELALCSVDSYECYSSWPRKWSQGRGKSQTNKDASENDMGALLDMLCAIFSRCRY